MRRGLGIAICLGILAITGGVLVTSASGQPAIHLVFGPVEDMRTAFIDHHRNGLRLGDHIASRGPLLDESQTERVGTAYQQCLVHKRIVDPDQGLWNCNYLLKLENGEIVLQGLDPRGPGEYQMAVLGGTGAYSGASGDATFTDIGNDPSAYTDIVIRLGG
ncbi:MAG TPA: hypothetical protein VHJ82_04240 [Actinomycetota bacterium]|nr:hypothetical protein [Actinomycetota bacterium]